MRIMKVIELDLVAEKERLEYELENLINDKNLPATEKVKQIKELLIHQTQNLNSLQMWMSYMGGINEQSENNNKEQK
tara:strand:+ start:78 stop:308 length:231 start_codon:yes stop_codon:yes gene_type:complete